ncbi:M1 family metallopeptidase [Aquabacterium sp.]|uniref:M1 family metallopeptidase n=1 Tax=Aquabacterium sp. TaxID=1872578 RepID=UPI002BA66325|nr:M1 family aminopeptidase [Aquabacterium sp.]HSW04774.1 M1 family aminopeptidase [Aquabacterium sp.]
MPFLTARQPTARRAIARLALFAALLLCSALATAATTAMRLPDSVRPLAYRLTISLDPAQPTHSGEVEIEIELKQATRSLQLHAKDLQIRNAWLEIGARRHAAKSRTLDPERIELRFAQAIPAGRAKLVLAFSGKQQDTDELGLFHRREAGDWYAYTQFESTGARLAFPLFDEPGWKVPWTLTLTVPQALMAVANTAPRREEAAATPGWKRIEFDPTPPLPSYLLAFAVGPFDVLDAPPAGALPIRFITPRGRAADAAFAAGITARIVERLEAYFDLPHPFAKLDSLALSVPSGFGAMEHAGLITYGAPLMLATPADTTGQFQRNYVSLAAHELAHQWFGNLVTMAWWDDLWLNESFASWLGDRITAELMPQWHWHTSVQQARARAMRTDRLASSRRVQQPVLSDDDMGSLWDSITYEKGQVVLSMFEQWLGPERFRDGVRRYIHKHAWGHATGDDFLAALGSQDPALPAALRSFTAQPGLPRVAVTLQCDEGPPRLQLRQSRLLPLPGNDTSAPPLWQIPMLIRTPAGSTRLLFDSREAALALPDTACPAWVQANAGGVGYYRVAYAPALWRQLMTQPDLPVSEILAGLDDAQGLSEAGDLPVADMLAMAEHFASHADRAVIEQSAELLLHARRMVNAAELPAYAARWQRAFGERARQLGWTAAPDENDEARLLRALLVEAVADDGGDATLRSQARAQVDAWLAQTGALDASSRAAVLASAALDGDEALFNALLAAARSAPDRALRRDLYAALGHFRAPRLAQRARDLLLDSSVDFREASRAVMSAHNQAPALREGLMQFLQTRHAELAKRMGRDDPAWLPVHLNQACSDDDAQRIARIFTPHAARYQGGRLALAQTLEQVRVCAAWRTRETTRVAGPGLLRAP